MKPGPPVRKRGRLVVVLLLAFAVHAAIGSNLSFAGIRPSLSLTVLLTACLFANCETGAYLGFILGLLEASYASRFIGSYIVTRTLAGYLVGLQEDRIFRDNAIVAAATVFVGTLFVETCFYLFAPHALAMHWFTSALLEAICNMIIALPVHMLLRKLIPSTPH